MAADDASHRLLEALPTGVAHVRDGRLVFVNDTLARKLRTPREQLIGRDGFSIVVPEERETIRARSQARTRGDEPPASYEVTCACGDGVPRPMEVRVHSLGPDEALILLRDLDASQREKRLFSELGSVSARVQRSRTVEAVVREAADGLGAHGFEVAVHRIHGTMTRRFYGPTLMPSGKPLVQREVPLAALPGAQRAVDEQRAVFFDDLIAEMRASAEAAGVAIPPQLLEEVRNTGLTRLLVVPLIVQGRNWGLAYISAQDLSSNALAALSLFCSQVSSALEVAEFIEAMQQQSRRQLGIQSIVLAARGAGLPELARRVLPIVVEACESDGGCLYAVEGAALALQAVVNAPQWVEEAYRQIPLAGLTTGTVTETRATRTLSLNDWPEPLRADVQRAGYREALLLPVEVDGKLLGMLALLRSGPRPFTDEESQAAAMIAAHVAVQMERTRLVTDLERSYDELARAQQTLIVKERLAALGELSAVVAHEVRNPLGAIFNSVATLRRMCADLSAARPLLDVVDEESERLDRLVGDLLDFARPYDPALQANALQEIVAAALESIARAVDLKGTLVRTELPADLPMVLVEAPLMRRAILNLALNAVQAMPSGGQLTVRAEPEQRRDLRGVRLDVADTGPGIPEDLGERIFQPFFTTRAAGTGLGLAVVKRIVDAHQAELSFKSSTGAGTTFSLWLRASG